MKISDFNTLNSHIGYGSSTPKIIFLGLEEGCDLATMSLNYKYRIGNIESPLLPLQSFHLNSGLESMTKLFKPTYPIQSTWNLYCQFALSYLEHTDITLDMRRDYQVCDLGSLDGITALVELYPLPRPNHNYWDVSLDVPSLFTGRDEYVDYCQTKNDTRINAITSLINNPEHEVTIIYGGLDGEQTKKDILELFPTLRFVKNHSFTNRIIKEYRLGSQKVFITYIFSTRNYSLNDIQDFAKIIKSS